MTYAIAAVEKVSKRTVVEHDFWNMQLNGFNANLRRAARLKGDKVFGLPPGQQIPVFPVGCFPKAPESWVRDAGSYVCPVDPDWALWFDWQDNDHENTAILPSVKGVNPITGRKTDGFALEQYAEKCPIHDVAFGAKRLCEKCGYQWPAQSYVASPNILWWDGWRQPDGTVRQFFFTSEDERDIASAIIGKENTMPAFGFAFYEPKEKEKRDNRYGWLGGVLSYEEPPYKHVMFPHNSLKGLNETKGGPGAADAVGPYDAFYYSSQSHTGQLTPNSIEYSCNCTEQEEKTSGGITRSLSKGIVKARSKAGGQGGQGERLVDTQGFGASLDLLGARGAESKSLRKEVSVGAGARIDQKLVPDPRGLSEYKDKPSAVIRLYFVFQGQFNDILKGGFKHPAGDSEGFLKGLPTG